MGLAAGHRASLIPYERSGRSCYCHANNGISFVATLIPVWPFQSASTVLPTPPPHPPPKQPLQQCSSVETINKSIRIDSNNCAIVYLSSTGPKHVSVEACVCFGVPMVLINRLSVGRCWPFPRVNLDATTCPVLCREP